MGNNVNPQKSDPPAKLNTGLGSRLNHILDKAPAAISASKYAITG